MSRTPQHFADRLKSALRSHARDPRPEVAGKRRSGVARETSALPAATTGSPGEDFARRLRAAIDA